MALRLTVTNTSFQKAELGAILLRNIFNIVSGVLVLFISVTMYNDPSFQAISTFMEFSMYSQEYQSMQFVNLANFLIVVIEAIMLATDATKRSLHDRIANTYVIEK